MSRITRTSWFVALTGFSLSAMCYGIYAQTTTLPPVVVTGQRIDGATIICRGYDCADALFQTPITPFNPDVDSISGDGPAVDGQQFCQNLKAKKPSGCSANNPPPSPGIGVPGQAAWQANGCGTGGLANVFLDVALHLSASNTYSGSLNAPHPGVSFLGACNSHDMCYAVATPKGTCDDQFFTAMGGACAGHGTACMDWAHAYRGGVGVSNAAQNAYNNSSSKRTCALWAMDMRDNMCPQ